MADPKIEKVLIEYLTETIKEVEKMASKDQGREILGDVINRPEDVEISVDQVGEEILEQLLHKHKLSATVFSEPEKREIKNGHSGEPQLYGAIDPFDGSVLYLRGFEENWFSCLSFFDKEKKPIATGIGGILTKKLYITGEKNNYVLDLTTGQRKKIFPSGRRSLGGHMVISSYVMSSTYSRKFFNIFGDLVFDMHPKALFYPNGGSFIYAYLAAGLIDTYIMFDEPRSEIDPGFPIAKRAGCEVVSVYSDGTYDDYQFLPGRQHDKVDLLIAAATPELRDQLIKYYAKKYEERYSFKT